MVDATNPMVFVRAKDLGLSGTEPPAAIDADTALVGAARGDPGGRGRGDGHLRAARPPPRSRWWRRPLRFTALDGVAYDAEQTDVVARCISMGNAHRAFALTAAMCLAVAAQIDGTVVSECAGGRGRRPAPRPSLRRAADRGHGGPAGRGRVGRARDGVPDRAPA